MTLEEWAAEEQANLWHDLQEQLWRALNGVWSIGAEGVCYRILKCAKIVGPTPWDEVPWELWAGGVYEAVLEVGSVAVPRPSPVEESKAIRLMTGHRAGASPDLLRAQFVRTVEAIKTDRQLQLDLEYSD